VSKRGFCGFKDNLRGRIHHEKDWNRSLGAVIGKAFHLGCRNNLVIDTTVSAMLEWRGRRWDDESEHERMVPFRPFSFGTIILLEVHFRNDVVTVFTSITDVAPQKSAFAFQHSTQDDKRVHNVHIIRRTRIDAVARYQAHNKRLYSLGLGEAESQAAADNGVFRWYAFWIRRTIDGKKVEYLSFHATKTVLPAESIYG